MGKFLFSLYRFLGSLQCALFLIGTTALFVIVGTVLESFSESHLFAAKLTYSHPLFSLLIWGFFLNILLSSLRRYPFKVKHIPFLITHLGLLMILSGVLVKVYFGTQGTLTLAEGASKQKITRQGEMALLVADHKNPDVEYRVDVHAKGPIPRQKDGLHLHLVNHYPHIKKSYSSWIKDHKLHIFGLSPMPIVNDDDEKIEIPKSSRARFYEGDTPWDIYAIMTHDVGKTFSKLYQQRSDTPLLAFIQDDHQDIYSIFIEKHGGVSAKKFLAEKPSPFISLDKGFKGYATEWILKDKQMDPLEKPLLESVFQVHGKAALAFNLQEKIKDACSTSKELSPPLWMWEMMCLMSSIPFAESFVAFLTDWDDSRGWLYPKEHALAKHLDFSLIPKSDLEASLWSATILEDLDLSDSNEILHNLEQKEWPLVEALKKQEDQNPNALLTLLTQQIFSASHALPLQMISHINEGKAKIFSAYLRAYDIHLSTLMPGNLSDQEKNLLLTHYFESKSALEMREPITLMTSIIPVFQKVQEKIKLEDNVPLIQVVVKKAGALQSIYLDYDQGGNGLKWPILDGQYLLSFKALTQAIPYKIRLRTARQINYPNSTQPHSYESDLIITDLRNGEELEKTISMNEVHETWDGYRFYLASMTPPSLESAKRVQIVVNHDPAKYFLTYPGAIILTLGIVLLFALRPYRHV